jgi:amidase
MTNTLSGKHQSCPLESELTYRSIVGVKTFTKAIIESQPWLKDPQVVRKPWSQQEYELVDHGSGKNLCFAIMWDNEVVRPHPPLHRAMQITKDALEAAGHKGYYSTLTRERNN